MKVSIFSFDLLTNILNHYQEKQLAENWPLWHSWDDFCFVGQINVCLLILFVYVMCSNDSIHLNILPLVPISSIFIILNERKQPLCMCQ